MSSFTYILHVPDCFYRFCRLRTLHLSRAQKPHQKVEKLRISRGFYTRLYGIRGAVDCREVVYNGHGLSAIFHFLLRLLFKSSAYVQLVFGEDAASIRVRLLYTALQYMFAR